MNCSHLNCIVGMPFAPSVLHYNGRCPSLTDTIGDGTTAEVDKECMKQDVSGGMSCYCTLSGS